MKLVCEAVFGSTKGASVVDLAVIVLFNDKFDTDRFTAAVRRAFFDILLSNLEETKEPEKMLALKLLHCIDEERGNVSNDSRATGNDGNGVDDNDANEEKDEEDEEEDEEKEEG